MEVEDVSDMGKGSDSVDLDQAIDYPATYGYQPLATGARPLARLRDSHHQIARLLATGMKDVEISAVTGYSQVRISTLKGDPLFRQAIDHYRENVTEAFADGLVRLNSVFLDSLSELHERVVEEPEAIGTPMLLSMVTELADRAGFGKQSKSTHVNVNVDLGGRLEAARKRALTIIPTVIDITPNEQAKPPAATLVSEPEVLPAASAPSSPEPKANLPFESSGETIQ